MHPFDSLDAYICWWIVGVGIVFPALYFAAGGIRNRVRAAAVRRARTGRTVNLTTRRSL